MSFTTEAVAGRTTPRIAVVTTTYVPANPVRNDGNQQENYLASVRYMLQCHAYFDPGVPYDLILVDNDSQNDEWLWILSQYTHHHRENTGFSFGGYEHAWKIYGHEYDYYLFHEQDIAPARHGWLKELMNIWESKEASVGALGNRIETNTGTNADLLDEPFIENFDGAFCFTSSEVLSDVGFDLLYWHGRSGSIQNELRFSWNIKRHGYDLLPIAKNDRTWFRGSSASEHCIQDSVAETITPLVTIHARRYPEIQHYFESHLMPDPLHYIYVHTPEKEMTVSHPVQFFPVEYILSDNEVNNDHCQTIFDLMEKNYRTRRKFFHLWPHVRYVVIHEEQGSVVGFAFISTPINWQVDYVTVQDGYRRRGIATSMVNEITNQARRRQVPYIMLTSVPELRSLYEGKCGYRVIS